MKSKLLKKFNIIRIVILWLFFLIGVICRVKGLIANPSMWHDECALGLNVLTRLNFFQPLDFVQVSPAFFLLGSKFLVNLFGTQSSAELCDFTLRIIPFTFGILSLIIFIPFANAVLKNKWLVCVAFLIFATNNALIQYSYEFKQYSADVFFAMAIILTSLKTNFDTASYRKLFLNSIIFALSIWFSSAAFFTLLPSCIILLIANFRNKKFYLFLSPLILSFILFLIFYLLPNLTGNYNNMNNYWENSFFTNNIFHNFSILKSALIFLLKPINLILFELIFIVWGLVYFAKKDLKVFGILGLSLLSPIIASSLHYYPFYDRLILFLIPIIITLIVAPLNYVNLKSKTSWIILVIFGLTFFQSVVLFEKTPKKSNAREMTLFLATHIKKQDKIFINPESKIDFAYYNYFHSIENEIISNETQLKNGYYWFYMPYNSKNTPTRDKIKKAIGQANSKKNLLYVQIK